MARAESRHRGIQAAGTCFRDQRGFTLIELLVVLSILALLTNLVTLSVDGIKKVAERRADQTTVHVLNDASRAYAVGEGIPIDAPFAPYTSDRQKMELLVEKGYLSAVPTPWQDGATYVWDDARRTWTLRTSLTALGSTFDEISQGFIERIAAYRQTYGGYPRGTYPYCYTDLGLDPTEWAQPIGHLTYRPRGHRLEIIPEEGYAIVVRTVDGEERSVSGKLGWSLWYDMLRGRWYSPYVSPRNEIDISTLQIVPES